MNKSKAILKTLRLPNLIMLAIVQFIVSHFFVEHYSFPFYLLITFSTISIALGGYLLNDIQDIEIDRFNNKLGWIDNGNKREATIIAIAMHILGLALGFYASSLSSLKLFPWFVGASMALVAYAFLLSKYKIIGNFLISGLIALAIILVYYLEINHPYSQNEIRWYEYLFVWVYAGLGFLLNWIREICKDIEDIEGDKQFGRYSLPIVLGKSVSKFFIGFVLIGFIAFMLFMGISSWSLSLEFIYLVIYFILFLLSLVILVEAQSIKAFKKLSIMLKILMFIGLITPALIILFQ